MRSLLLGSLSLIPIFASAQAPSSSMIPQMSLTLYSDAADPKLSQTQMKTAQAVTGTAASIGVSSKKSEEGVVTEKKAPAKTKSRGSAAQEFFTGAFVFGVTGIWGPATDREYRGVKVPGSEQAEISVVSQSEIESDIVLGYVHYLEDQGPTGCRGVLCFSPIIGLGVYSWRTEDLFKSLVFGANYQFNRHVSLAAVLALRRVNVLRDEVRLGMPGEDGGEYSDEDYRLGWGFMLNFSPDILKSGFKATRTLDFSSVSEKLTE